VAVTGYKAGFQRNDSELGASGQPMLAASATWTGNGILKAGFQRRDPALDSDERVLVTNIASLTGTGWVNGFLRILATNALAAVQDTVVVSTRMRNGFLRSEDAATLGALVYSLAPQPAATERAGFLRSGAGALVLG